MCVGFNGFGMHSRTVVQKAVFPECRYMDASMVLAKDARYLGFLQLAQLAETADLPI